MMDSKKGSSRITSTPTSACSSRSRFNSNSSAIWGIYIILLLGVLIVLIMLFIRHNKKNNSESGLLVNSVSPLDNKLVVNRFRRAYNIWNTVASDPMFVMHTKTLMDINSSSSTNGIVDKGSKDIYDAYMTLHHHVKEDLKFPEESRITVMYNDGIVFYDSVLKINNVFFMRDGLPRPVNLYTLGSPLKDHNMLPEVANSVIVTDSSDNRLSGMLLTDPFYRKLVNEGYVNGSSISYN